MTETPVPIDGFLSEFRASLSQPTGDAVFRRINAERLLRLLADEFIESHEAERIRILADNRLAGKPGADFLMQIDDYDVRLEFLDSPSGKPVLAQDRLGYFSKMLEDNPSTVAIVLVWTTDDLQSIALSDRRVRHLSQHPEDLSKLLQESKPLHEVLKAIVGRQMKQWEFDLARAPRSTAQPADIRRLFEQAIGEAIDAERDRSYRNVERKLAAQQFPAEEEKRLIFGVLKEALGGTVAKELVPMLTRLSRRGAK